MANYRLSAEAKEDLRRIYMRGLRAFGEARADRYYHALFDKFDEIAAHPLMYQSVDEIRVGYRRAVCGSDSIYYRIGSDGVEIMAIIGRQDTDDWL
jgi:toxin ParE1/3/4